jgi:hypothetical protein
MKRILFAFGLLALCSAVGGCGGGGGGNDSTSDVDGEEPDTDGDTGDRADRTDVPTDTPPVDNDGDTYPEGEDCDDTDAEVFPGATETCNGVDDNCDAATDEDTAVDASTWYADTDRDGFGDADTTRTACAAPTGFVADATDCDDTDGAVNPDATETCNGVDDDCDGETDENGADGATAYYPDTDLDGYGDDAGEVLACAMPDGYTPFGDDCNDADAAINPGAAELCNGVDDNCDGTTDENTAIDAPTFFRDVDGDTFGDPLDTAVACAAPSGYVPLGGDCNDGDVTIRPGASDIPDPLSLDSNCDGIDGDVSMAVFVSASAGDDAHTGLGTFHADGSLTVEPVLTLARGLEIADACDPKCYVLIEEGTYDQGATPLALREGVSLYGGYDATWARVRPIDATVVTSTASPAILADTVTMDMFIERLTIRGPDISTPGGESVALLVQATGTPDRLTLREVTVVGGHGGPGTAGSNRGTRACSCPGGAGGVAVTDPCETWSHYGGDGACKPDWYWHLGGGGGQQECFLNCTYSPTYDAGNGSNGSSVAGGE